MQICAFLGGRVNVYDIDIAKRAGRAVHEVLGKSDKVLFLFAGKSAFEAICHGAVMEAKRKVPGKVIRLGLVYSEPFEENWPFDHFWRSVPLCSFDYLIETPDYNEKKGGAVEEQKKLRRMFRRADFLISYVYEPLYDSDGPLLRYARKLDGLTVLNAANPDTAAFIVDEYRTLPAEQSYALRQRLAGAGRGEIGETLSITPTAVSKCAYAGGRKLRETLERRCRAMQIQRGPERPLTCGVLLLGEAEARDQEVVNVFGAVVRHFLYQRIPLRFLVEQNQCGSAFANLLQYTVNGRQEVTLEVVTGYQANTPEALREIKARYVPPYHDVLNIDFGSKTPRNRNTQIGKAIIDRSDVLICNLESESDIAGVYKNHLKNKISLQLFDLSKKPERISAAEFFRQWREQKGE